MKIPNAERAIVAEGKITRYLLDPSNLDNQGKHGFFFQFGFIREAWDVLSVALREHANQYEVTATEVTEHGVKYRVVGALATPDGRNPIVRSVWIVLHGEDIPRFVTAVPNERRRR